MKILVIAPHMDDETLGMGATIARHVAKGDKVFIAIMAYRIYEKVYNKKIVESEKKAVLKAKEVLGYQEVIFFDLQDERLDTAIQDILIPLENYYNKIKPDILYVNFYQDNNQDHRATFEAVRIVIRSVNKWKVPRVLMYEVPSSTDQSPPLKEAVFLPNFYVNIEKYLDKKIKALNCYKREKRKFPHPRSKEAILALAKRRGVESGFKLAEAFMILRDQWK
ncbi:MAG: PIG-L family deacetylase [Armatimonadetes bacterium]|nr:PIG-L family deacetylase [Armatimonadota bacterium]